jgi:hypothetical protein
MFAPDTQHSLLSLTLLDNGGNGALSSRWVMGRVPVAVNAAFDTYLILGGP